MKSRKSQTKGQSSIENLILYGVVILVVVVSVVVLWQMGAFMPFIGKRGYVGFSQIVPQDWVVGSGKAYISVKNAGEATLRIDAGDVNMSVGVVGCSQAPENTKIFPSGDVWVIEISCEDMMKKYAVGDYFETDISINYTNLISGRKHASVGKIYGHIEEIGAGGVPTTTTTTILPQPQCFEKECDTPGELDIKNCGEIVYDGECVYCPINPAPDGKNRCWFKSKCGSQCNVNNDCSPDDPFNLCKDCVDGVCREVRQRDACGPCPSSDWGTNTSMWCDDDTCRYCHRRWTQMSELPGDGYYSYTCRENTRCGRECVDHDGVDLYDVCIRSTTAEPNNCPHCMPDPENPGIGTCEQGDCGRRCGPDAEYQECEKGCLWCNDTATGGETPSYKCEIGDCGKACTPENQQTTCTLGCDVCHDGVCVKTDIGVTLEAHNGSHQKAIRETVGVIHLDTSAKCKTGIEKVIVSESLYIGTIYGNAAINCSDIKDEVSAGLKSMGYEDPTSPEAKIWLETNYGIIWNTEEHDCLGEQNCANTWLTSENELGSYCYFAAAKKHGSSGTWSPIVSDYVQIGLIEVYLIYPPSGMGE